MVVSCGDGAVDLEMSEDPLDAIAFAVEAFVIADRPLAVRLRWDDGLDAAPL